MPVLAIIPLRSIEDGLLRRGSYASLQTGHQMSKIQIATTKWNLASAQSIKAVFMRKMDFLPCTGLCVRRVEDFIAGSERRYLVLNRTPYAAEPGATIPEPVVFFSDVIPSPFFSVDVARCADGVERIVEIGDG